MRPIDRRTATVAAMTAAVATTWARVMPVPGGFGMRAKTLHAPVVLRQAAAIASGNFQSAGVRCHAMTELCGRLFAAAVCLTFLATTAKPAAAQATTTPPPPPQGQPAQAQPQAGNGRIIATIT